MTELGKKLNLLKSLVKETTGSSFTLTYSTQRDKWLLSFLNIYKCKFDSDSFEYLIDLAISFIKTRRKISKKTGLFTIRTGN
jgi:hypothetical protein